MVLIIPSSVQDGQAHYFYWHDAEERALMVIRGPSDDMIYTVIIHINKRSSLALYIIVWQCVIFECGCIDKRLCYLVPDKFQPVSFKGKYQAPKSIVTCKWCNGYSASHAPAQSLLPPKILDTCNKRNKWMNETACMVRSHFPSFFSIRSPATRISHLSLCDMSHRGNGAL